MFKKMIIALSVLVLAGCSTTGNLTKTNGDKEMAIYQTGRGASFIADILILPVSIASLELADTDPGAYLTGQRCAYKLCTTVTICDKNGHNCKKIGHMLVDTSITGVHVFNSAMSSNLKKVVWQGRYVSKDDETIRSIRDCVETDGGAIDGYVSAVVIKYGNIVEKTNAQIVKKYGNKTNCANYVITDSFVRRNNDRGMMAEREEGINGILGLGISTKNNGHEDNFLYTGGSVNNSYDFPLVQPLAGAKNFLIKVPDAGRTGYIKFMDASCKGLKPTHKHPWIFDTGDWKTYVSNAKVKADNDEQARSIVGQENNPPAMATGNIPGGQGNFGGSEIESEISPSYYDPEPLWTKALGDMSGKTYTFCTSHGQRIVRVGKEVYLADN